MLIDEAFGVEVTGGNDAHVHPFLLCSYFVHMDRISTNHTLFQIFWSMKNVSWARNNMIFLGRLGEGYGYIKTGSMLDTSGAAVD